MKREKIVLDCDPGHDDALAILLAGASEELELLGITTVAGNSCIEDTTNNALVITELAHMDVPVCKGASKPLVRDQITAPNIHGKSGLDGADLPKARGKAEKWAIDFIADKIQKNPGEVTLVSTGPMTNLALFILGHPDLCYQVKGIVAMGGGIAFGNTTPVAEFNIYADPEAAQIVFNSGIPLTIFPLDVTHQSRIYLDEIEEIKKFPSDIVAKMGALLKFFYGTYRDVFAIDGAPLHDPCTIAFLIDHGLFEFEEYYSQVEIRGGLTYGQTVVDYWKLSGKRANAKWAVKVDRDGYVDLIFRYLRRY